METRKILIPDGEAIAALNIAFCLKNEGFDCEVIAASTNPRSISRFSRYIDKVVHVSPNREVDDLCKMIAEEQVDVLIPIAVRDIRMVSENRAVFEALCTVVLLPTAHQLDRSTDKFSFSQLMIANGISTPETWRLDDLPESLADLPFPLILKPVSGSGGMGIMRIDSSVELQTFIAGHPNKMMEYLVQKFIGGHDVDCSVYCNNGEIIAYTIQRGVSSASRLYKPPASIEFIQDDKALELTTNVISALKFSGVAHVDLRYDDQNGNLYVLELNPRYWASILGSLSAGINFPCIAVKNALGMAFDDPEYEACRFVRFSSWLRQFPNKHINLKETNIKYLIRDPLPRLFHKLSRVI